MLTFRIMIEVGIFLAFSTVAACLIYDAFNKHKKRKSRKKKIPPGLLRTSSTFNTLRKNDITGDVAINHNYTPTDAFSIEFLRATIEAQQKTIDRLYDEKEKLTEENDALWNEVVEYKYCRTQTIPFFEMPETNKKI